MRLTISRRVNRQILDFPLPLPLPRSSLGAVVVQLRDSPAAAGHCLVVSEISTTRRYSIDHPQRCRHPSIDGVIARRSAAPILSLQRFFAVSLIAPVVARKSPCDCNRRRSPMKLSHRSAEIIAAVDRGRGRQSPGARRLADTGGRKKRHGVRLPPFHPLRLSGDLL